MKGPRFWVRMLVNAERSVFVIQRLRPQLPQQLPHTNKTGLYEQRLLLLMTLRLECDNTNHLTEGIVGINERRILLWAERSKGTFLCIFYAFISCFARGIKKVCVLIREKGKSTREGNNREGKYM